MTILGHWVANAGGNSVWVSPELAGQLWGEAVPRIVSRDALEGATLASDRPIVRAAEERVTASGRAESVSFVLVTFDGRRMPVRERLEVLRNGEQQTLVGSIETDSPGAPAPRRDWPTLLGRAIERATSSAIAVEGGDGAVAEYDGAYYHRLSAMTGIDAALLRQPGGARLFGLAAQAVDPEEAAKVIAAIEADASYEGRDRVRLRDGRTLERFTGPISDPEGHVLGRLWYFRDITETERATDGLRLLAEANALLLSSLDPGELLERLARLLVPRLADWCFVGPLSGDSPVAVSPVVITSDEGRAPFARAIRESWERGLAGEAPVDYQFFQPITRGESIFLPAIEPGVFDLFGDSEARDIMREAGFRSAIVVPLRRENQLIGTLAVVTSTSGRTYDEAHVRLIEDFGYCASLAATNAQRFREMGRISEELRKANQAKDELMGIVSHELRTPLTIIQGGARMLRDQADRLDAQERSAVLGDMEEAAARLQVMVENMLLLAQAELSPDITPEPVLAQRVIRATIDQFTRQHPSRQVSADLADAPPVAGRSTFLEEVVSNLLSNADRYSPPEMPIDVRFSVEGPRGVVRVLDRGFGITPEEAAAAFEPFFRSPRAQLQRGAGLGLPACRRMVEAMGGEIWIRPRDGGGVEAGFSIPLYREEEAS